MVRHKDDGYSEDKDGKTCPRDSGYDSLSNRLSILDRLLHTHPIWLQLSLSEEEAAEVLQNQPPGVRPKTRGRLGQACCYLTEKHLEIVPESSSRLLGGFQCRPQIQYRGILGSTRQFLKADLFQVCLPVFICSMIGLYGSAGGQGIKGRKSPGQRSWA